MWGKMAVAVAGDYGIGSRCACERPVLPSRRSRSAPPFRSAAGFAAE